MKILILICLVLTGNAFGNYLLKDAPEMIGGEIEKEVSDTLDSLKNVDLVHKNRQAWVCSRIRLLLKPYVAFDSKLLEISVAPLFEFRWARKPPKGWKWTRPIPQEHIR
jgi:hypothetical protein